ncbi:sensor domain-containing diguanylate cyclase [Neobacillus jeddahensis]|uniref:sensor domain-containing diguanylate cyclase n=1 Tax=Neobacillus jeddahensis TaxID=1461580 RepID=UPI000693A96D|nr:sensor domain-containing diguanylate cyclase [Neobacillus jeddahensis]
MLKDFITNATLLIASFSIIGALFKDKPLSSHSSFQTKLYWGLCFGILGNILMSFTIQISANSFADLRHVAIVIAAAFGGAFPAIIAAGLIAIGRIVLFGFSESAIIPSIGMLLIGIICGVLFNLRCSRTLKAFLMNLCGLLILTIIYLIKIDDLIILKHVLPLHFLISLIGGFFGYHCFVFITESNQAQNELKQNIIRLQETEERFRLIAEYSSDMITMHNENTEYIYISPAVSEVIHFEYPELLGKKMEMFIHPEDVERTNEMFKLALLEGTANSTYRYLSKMGDYVWIESTLKRVPFQVDGKVRVINVSRNITDRKLTEHKLQEANELLNRLSYMDGLTGISNRRYFDETLEKEWVNAYSTNTPLTLIMFDIDYFKKYNDTYGHPAGDLCLQTIAQTINNAIVVPSDYTFCRYGGEEFALILTSKGLQEGIKVAQHLQNSIRSLHIPHEGSEISNQITLSIGLATKIPTSPSEPEKLIEAADTALYLSKENGRNTISTN